MPHYSKRTTQSGMHTRRRKKQRKQKAACDRLGWQMLPFVADVCGGLGNVAQALVASLLKGILARQDVGQRRGLEASVWQSLLVSPLGKIGK